MDLKPECREGFLWGTLTGRISLKEALEVFKRACDTAVELGLDRILMDVSAAEGLLSDLDRYKLGHNMAEYYRSRSPSMKVAVVGKPPLVDGFAAQIAFNRGIAAATFSEVNEAVSWLKRFG
jgi:hypothetical protein